MFYLILQMLVVGWPVVDVPLEHGYATLCCLRQNWDTFWSLRSCIRLWMFFQRVICLEGLMVLIIRVIWIQTIQMFLFSMSLLPFLLLLLIIAFFYLIHCRSLTLANLKDTTHGCHEKRNDKGAPYCIKGWDNASVYRDRVYITIAHCRHCDHDTPNGSDIGIKDLHTLTLICDPRVTH